MIPGPARILTCPYCGGKKEVFSYLSTNTFGAKLWSDGKMEAPKCPEVSPVQKCPYCEKYYYIANQQEVYGENESFNLGKLSFAECHKAFLQFEAEQNSSNSIFNIFNLFVKTKRKKLSENYPTLLQTAIYAYNDEYGRVNKEDAATEDNRQFFQMCLSEMLNKYPHALHPLYRAEYYREYGDLEACISILDGHKSANEQEEYFASEIRKRAINKDTRVFFVG